MKLKDLSFQFNQQQKCCPPKQLFKLSFNNHFLLKSRQIYLESDVFVKLSDIGNQPRKRRFQHDFLELDLYTWIEAHSFDSSITHRPSPVENKNLSGLRLSPWVGHGATQPTRFLNSPSQWPASI